MALILLFILAVAAVAAALYFQNKTFILEEELEVAAMFVQSSKEEGHILAHEVQELEKDVERLTEEIQSKEKRASELERDQAAVWEEVYRLELERDAPHPGSLGLELMWTAGVDSHDLHKFLLELPQELPLKGWIPPELLSWLNKKEGEPVFVHEVVQYLQ